MASIERYFRSHEFIYKHIFVASRSDVIYKYPSSRGFWTCCIKSQCIYRKFVTHKLRHNISQFSWRPFVMHSIRHPPFKRSLANVPRQSIEPRYKMIFQLNCLLFELPSPKWIFRMQFMLVQRIDCDMSNFMLDLAMHKYFLADLFRTKMPRAHRRK